MCVLLVAALMFFAHPAEAMQLTPAGCESFAEFVQSAAERKGLVMGCQFYSLEMLVLQGGGHEPQHVLISVCRAIAEQDNE